MVNIIINMLSFDFERIYGISLVPWCRGAPGASGPGGVRFPVFCEGFKEPPQSSLSAFRLVLSVWENTDKYTTKHLVSFRPMTWGNQTTRVSVYKTESCSVSDQ